MKLLDAIRNVTVEDVKMIQEIKEALIQRQEVIELQEPMCDGYAYNKWDEKYTDITYLIENVERLQQETDVTEKENILAGIRMDATCHQVFYGGLKRLVI